MGQQLAERLKKAIQAAIEKGDTYKGIAERAGVDPAAVWRFAKGQRSIDVVIASKLLDAMGLEVREKAKRPRRKGGK